jgi:hypothetical protein
MMENRDIIYDARKLLKLKADKLKEKKIDYNELALALDNYSEVEYSGYYPLEKKYLNQIREILKDRNAVLEILSQEEEKDELNIDEVIP